jgi:hypothetical protein
LYALEGKVTSGSAGYFGTVCTDPLGILIGKVTGQMSPFCMASDEASCCGSTMAFAAEPP